MLVKRDIKWKTLYISHTNYIQDLLSIYNMIGANPISISIIKGSIILYSKGKNTEFDFTDYQCLVGKLIHLS